MSKVLVSIAAALAISSLSAASDLAGKILTVSGPVDPGTLGVTMPHEHVFLNWNSSSQVPALGATKVGFYLKPLTMDMLGAVIMGYSNRDNRILGSEETAIQELEDCKRQGGGAIVDVTSVGYSFVLRQFVPHLRKKGVTKDQIQTLLIENPRRALTLAAPK